MGYQMLNDEELTKILTNGKRIAIVGISNKPDRASYRVSKYLLEVGYEIIPVNPVLDEVHGIKAVKSLDQIEGKIDIVDVFRRSEETESVAAATAQTNADTLWLQLGIYNEESAKIATDAGQKVVMDRCILNEHKRLLG